MKIKKLTSLPIVFIFSFLCLSGQNEKLVRIVLEKGKTDVLQIEDKKIKKAYIYGTKENVIKFLINDKYIEHQIERGVIYNFLFSEKIEKKDPASYSKTQMKNDSNKILIVTHDSNSYQKIYKKAFETNKTDPSVQTFKLGEVNNLKVFVSKIQSDTALFDESDKDIASIELVEDRSDLFQVDGDIISKVTIFGTKENIIRFLINDKYIKHRLDEGSSYMFLSSKKFSKIIESTEDKDLSQEIIIVLDNKKEFLELYNSITDNKKKEITEDMSFHLDTINNIKVLVLAPDKLINP